MAETCSSIHMSHGLQIPTHFSSMPRPADRPETWGVECPTTWVNVGGRGPASRALGGDARNAPSLPSCDDAGVRHRWSHRQRSGRDRAMNNSPGKRDGEPVLVEP